MVTVVASMGPEVCERIMAVVEKPSSVASPAASGPKAGTLATVLPPVAGSSRKFDGSGMRPAPGSVSTCAARSGAIWKVEMSASSLCGKALSITWKGKRYALRICSSCAPAPAAAPREPSWSWMSAWFSGRLRSLSWMSR